MAVQTKPMAMCELTDYSYLQHVFQFRMLQGTVTDTELKFWSLTYGYLYRMMVMGSFLMEEALSQ